MLAYNVRFGLSIILAHFARLWVYLARFGWVYLVEDVRWWQARRMAAAKTAVSE